MNAPARLTVLSLIGFLGFLLMPVGLAESHEIEGASSAIVVDDNETVGSIDAFTGSLVIRGTVEGDIEGAAGSIHIMEGGTVDGTIEAAAGTVTIDGTVNGDVRVGGGTVEVSETASINGSLEAGGGYVSVDGRVTGDARLGGGTVTIGPNADIGGDLIYNAQDFSKDPAAQIAGSLVQDEEMEQGFGMDVEGPELPDGVGSVYGLLVNAVAGILLLTVFPRFSRRVADRVDERPTVSAGIGLVTLVAVPVALILVALTLVGLPFTVAGLGVFLIAAWAAIVYGQYAVGEWIVDRLDREGRYLALGVGLLTFAVLDAVPVLGGLAAFVAFLLGLGAMLSCLLASYRESRSDA